MGVVALLSARGQAADRAGPAAVAANPMAEITDLYAWMAASNLNLVMDVSPFDDGTHSFDPTVQYVFHLTSKSGIGVGAPGGTETKVILRFASNTSVEGWVTDAGGVTIKDYVSGDPSNLAGIRSRQGRVRVFAGRRSDPNFSNPTDFSNAVTVLGMNLMNEDAAGCPAIVASAAGTIRNMLTGQPVSSDTFATANVMAIVVQVDKSLVNVDSNTAVGIWGSTHAGS